jgi:hypothetical protein
MFHGGRMGAVATDTTTIIPTTTIAPSTKSELSIVEANNRVMNGVWRRKQLRCTKEQLTIKSLSLTVHATYYVTS